MNQDEYIVSIKERFGDQATKDGQLIRDMNDDELLRRMLERYPGDRDKIIDLDESVAKDVALPEPTKETSQLQQRFANVANAAKTRFANQKSALGKSVEGEQGIGSGVLQAVGQGAGFLGDVAFEGAKALTPDVVKEPIKQALGAVASTAPVQGALEGYEAWKAQHPEAAANLEATTNIVTTIPGLGGGVKLAEKGVETGIDVAKGVAKRAPAITENVVDATKAGTAVISEKLAPNLEKEAIDVAVIGPQGKKQTISSLERSGQEGGFAPDESLFGKISGADKYVPTARDIEVANSVKGIVRKSNPPSKNLANINNKISEVSETIVRPALKANPQPFNTATYAKKLREVEMPDFIKADSTLANTYEMVRNRFLDVVKKGVKTKEGLWEARKDIDQVIEQQFGAAGFNPDKYSALQKAILDMRRATNDFIAEGIPDDTFRKEMRNMSNMYRARHNIALDNYAIQNKPMIIKFALNNPKKWATLKLAGLGVLLSGGGAVLLPD